MSNPSPSPSSWNIIACPACGGKFKTPLGTTDSEMACPHCGESVSLGVDAPHAEPSEAWPPEELAPILRDPGPVRRRRRSGPELEPEWDQESSPASDAVAGSDDMTEYLTGDPSDPDSLRIKRVRRKKNLTGTQKFGRLIIIGTITIVVLATAIAITLLVKEQVNVVQVEAEARRELPGKVAELVAQALATRNDSAILTKAEEEACLSIINGFYSAQTIEEKLNFVRLPERVKPMLEKAYATDRVRESIAAGEIVLSQKLIDKGRRFITLAALIEGSDQTSQMFAFEQLNDTILMDWEVSSGYQQVPIRQFISQKRSEPTVFRTKITRSDYYAGHFQDRERYQSVSLTYPGQDEFKLAGYIDRQKPWADVLLARLEFEAPSLIVTLQYPPDSSSAFEVEVSGVVLDSWYY